MPPIRSKSQQKSANQEGKILLARDDIKNGRIKISARSSEAIRDTACYTTPPLTTRAKGQDLLLMVGIAYHAAHRLRSKRDLGVGLGTGQLCRGRLVEALAF
jgi:hypothetical protein